MRSCTRADLLEKAKTFSSTAKIMDLYVLVSFRLVMFCDFGPSALQFLGHPVFHL